MVYDWYNIVNRTEFLALGIPSQTMEVILEDVGLVEILITLGSEIGLLYNGVFLTYNLNGQNPFEFQEHAIYKDENDDIWLGIAVGDE